MTGTIEVTVFDPVVTKYKKHLHSGNLVLVKARLEKEIEVFNLLGEEIIPL